MRQNATPWRRRVSRKGREPSWYQRLPDAITSHVWSVVNRPLGQPLVPTPSFALTSLRLNDFSLCQTRSPYLPSASFFSPLFVSSPWDERPICPAVHFHSLPPSFPIQSAQLWKSLPNKRVPECRPRNFRSQIEWGRSQPVIGSRSWNPGWRLYRWKLLLSREENSTRRLCGWIMLVGGAGRRALCRNGTIGSTFE